MIRGKSRAARHRPEWLLALGVGLVVLATGCGGGPKRSHVSGRILYDGKPVPAGEIYFDPDVTKGHDGPQGFARIQDGKYDTRAVEKSLAPGPHVVRILGFDGKPAPELPFGRPLFAEYTKSVDLTAQGDSKLDFEIPARGQSR
jgi:hypothetical protein